MTRSAFIANRLEEVLLNGTWIANTNYKAQIKNINWQQATQQVGTLNTIALLTHHVNYYLGGLLNVFNGGALEIRDQFSFDMPPIQSETDWKNLCHDFLTNAELFIQHVSKIEEEQWDTVFVDERYGTYYRNIEGVIEHCYYHLGQISLIKKLVLK